DLLKSNSSRLLLASGDGLDFQALLVDEDRAWLMVGAKNHIFLLHLDHPSREPEKIFWPASREQVEHCQLAGKNVETECANFIRLLQPFNRSHVFACGTGSYQPVCAFVQLGARGKGPGAPTMRLVTHSLESGRGRCPYSPHEPFTGLLIDGELYSGTSSDFMGSSAAFFRTWVHGAEQSYIRTEQNQDHWLHEPAFVGAYAIPDTYNPHDDKVYIFFRETAMEAGQWERRHIHARVARVCKVSLHRPACCSGVSHQMGFHLLWATGCSKQGPTAGREGVTTPSTEKRVRAWGCPAAGTEVFVALGEARRGWTEPGSRPRVATQCPSETYDPLLQSTKDFPDEVISFMRTHQLMWEPVYPQGRQPVLVRVNVPYRLRRAPGRRGTESNWPQPLCLGLLAPGLAHLGTQLLPEQSGGWQALPPTPRSPCLPMPPTPAWGRELWSPSSPSLQPYGSPWSPCSLAALPWRGPTAWVGSTPQPHLLSHRRSRCQDALKSDPLGQCQATAEGTVAVEKLVFGVEKNSTFLECLARSPQTTVRWLVRRVLEQGLLIRQLAREDAGTYECQAVERSFSRPLTQYSLRVIRHEAME
ncbi:Semaphorin-3D, partial [Podiceps cristatus]